MIKFFRHIRKSLLMENKTGKYFKYAIGEILLVVIGILIALQINNWNENRIKKQFEVTILKNIQQDILADKTDFILNHEALKEFTKNEQLLLDFLISDSSQPTDTINYANALGADLMATFHTASYNNLQNNDVGLIRNNTLYKEITRFYDFYLTGIKYLENNHDYANTYDDKFVFFKKHFKIINKKNIIKSSNEESWSQELIRYDFEIKNLEMLKKDEEFKMVLAESLMINGLKISFYQQVFEKTAQLNALIINELKTLEE